MADRTGWVAPRIERKHLDGPLFADWRLRAWVCMCSDADITTGELIAAGRELAVRFGASKGTFERWIADMETAGYVSTNRLGDTPRKGRTLLITYISERDTSWGNQLGKAGANVGALNGANKTSDRKVKVDIAGANIGAISGAKLGQKLGHVVSKEEEEEVITVPTVPCTPGANDLFGETTVERSPVAPSEPEPDKPSTVAKRVLAVFHDLSKARGGNGVQGAVWAAQQKMAENALKTILSEQEATDALRWGMGEEYWRQRLRGHQMKVLVDVWSAWVEQTGGSSNGRNGNGRNGAGHAGGETGAGASTGGGEAYLNNGRWERR